MSVFEKAYQLGLAWGFKELALAAISGIAVVQDEYLHDSAKAHATINQLADGAGLDSHQVDDRRADIFFTEGKPSPKPKRAGSVPLSRWPAADWCAVDQSVAFAARSAGVARGENGKWEAFRAAGPSECNDGCRAERQAVPGWSAWRMLFTPTGKLMIRKKQIISAIEAGKSLVSLLPKRMTTIFECFAARECRRYVIASLHGAITDTGVENLDERQLQECAATRLLERDSASWSRPSRRVSGSSSCVLERNVSARDRAATAGKAHPGPRPRRDFNTFRLSSRTPFGAACFIERRGRFS